MAEPSRLVWRSDLGWPSRSPADYANPKKGLVVHYDSSDQGLAEEDHSACVDYWNWCRDFHLNVRGWDDVGYSFMACAHGYILEGRGLHRYQAAQGTTAGNANYYSVTLACGPNDEITDAQVDAVRELRAWLMEPSTSIRGKVLGHRDFKRTSCPGDSAYAMVSDGTFAQPPGSSIPDTGSGGGGRYRPEDGDGVYERYEHGGGIEDTQQALADDGYDLAVDGYYGPETEAVVTEYQRDHGLTVDGLAGPETLGHLHGDETGPSRPFPLDDGHWFGTPSRDDRNHSGYYWASDRPHIKRIQRRLGGLSVDGRYGPKTQREVREFQDAAGLSVDGLVGVNTWGRLF